ncbi:hypothetical protein, partial [Microbacterium sp. Ag1]|uniref:hypothetical protein n=1 Tax=Microbacterium sp. Ag1 TaxID=1643443 RepID=UPI0012E042CC
MMWNKLSPRFKVVLLAGGIPLLAFILLCISAAIWGAWWRFESMPTADEWQALFGATVLVALAFAWFQIRQVESSNRQLIRANDLARDANLELSRPRVLVFLDADRQVRKERSADTEGVMHIAVKNIGSSPALNVRLSVDVPFQSMEEFFITGMMDQHLDGINAIFDGSVSFPSLRPNSNSYVWFLGRLPQLFDAPANVARRYEVTATYDSTAGQTYTETMILDIDIERRIEFPAESVKAG